MVGHAGRGSPAPEPTAGVPVDEAFDLDRILARVERAGSLADFFRALGEANPFLAEGWINFGIGEVHIRDYGRLLRRLVVTEPDRLKLVDFARWLERTGCEPAEPGEPEQLVLRYLAERPEPGINRRLADALARQSSYGEMEGSVRLNTLFADLFNARFRFPAGHFSMHDVVAFSGANEAIISTADALAGGSGLSGIRVVVSYPFYPYGRMLSTSPSVAPVFIPALSADEYVGNLAGALERERDIRLVIVNSPHNPAGYVFREEHVVRVNELAARHGFYILADTVYAPFVKDAGVNRALAGFDATRTVYVDSLSKWAGMPGLRVGAALTKNARLARLLALVKANRSIGLSSLSVAFAEAFLEWYAADPDNERQITGVVKDRYDSFYAAVEEWRDGFAAIGVTFGLPADDVNTMYWLADVEEFCRRTGMRDVDIQSLLYERKINVVAGELLVPKDLGTPADGVPPRRQMIRGSLGGIELDFIPEAVERLYRELSAVYRDHSGHDRG